MLRYGTESLGLGGGGMGSSVDWVDLAWDKGGWRAVVNTVMNCSSPCIKINFRCENQLNAEFLCYFIMFYSLFSLQHVSASCHLHIHHFIISNTYETRMCCPWCY
jgi:hypothetical protein